MKSISKVKERLENIVVAVVSCFLVLLFVGIAIPSVWVFIFSALVSYVTADLIMNLFIHSGESHAKKYFSKDEVMRIGHPYVIFLVGIIISTVISALLAEAMFRGNSQGLPWWEAVLITDTYANILVLLDLMWRFYGQDK